MIEKFTEELARLLAQNPDSIKIEKIQIDKDFYELFIYADKEDAGKLIGRDGKMINAIKTLITGCKAKDGISYKVTVKAHGE